MPNKKLDLFGKRFGRLTVQNEYKVENGKVYFWCKCDCGNSLYVLGTYLRNGNTKSCGCLEKEKFHKLITKHNKCYTRIYRIYHGMITRCFNKNAPQYKGYGMQGITVCDKWKNSFEEFYKWSMENGYSDSLTIDRINVFGNYEPSNCRWISKREQQFNKKNTKYITVNGSTKNAYEWEKITGIKAEIIDNRVRKGKSGNDLFAPVRKRISISIKGENYCLKEAAEIIVISKDALRKRYESGLTGEKLTRRKNSRT